MFLLVATHYSPFTLWVSIMSDDFSLVTHIERSRQLSTGDWWSLHLQSCCLHHYSLKHCWVYWMKIGRHAPLWDSVFTAWIYGWTSPPHFGQLYQQWAEKWHFPCSALTCIIRDKLVFPCILLSNLWFPQAFEDC